MRAVKSHQKSLERVKRKVEKHKDPSILRLSARKSAAFVKSFIKRSYKTLAGLPKVGFVARWIHDLFYLPLLVGRIERLENSLKAMEQKVSDIDNRDV